MFQPDRKPASLNLAEWDQIVVANAGRAEGNSPALTREQLIALVDTRNLHWLAGMREQLNKALEKWDGLSHRLDARTALDAPSRELSYLRTRHRK